MNPYFDLRGRIQHAFPLMLRLHMLILTALALPTFTVATPSANAQTASNQGAGVTGNPLQDWTVVNGNAGAAGNISLNVFHFFMWALMGVITIFGIKSCIAAASSGQTQQLWPRIMATVLGLAIPFFVNWITTTAGN